MGETWAGVVRVSHMGVRKAGADNVHTDRDQVATMQRAARDASAELEVLPPELDVSGGLVLEQRPSLQRAVQGVEAGTYDAIVVAYLSRLGRNVVEQLKVWDRVEAAGGHIVVVQEGIDTSTSHGRFLRTVLLANAAREREEHADRFENLRMHAVERGIWQRRQTPRGYDRDTETRRLVPNDQAHEIGEAMRDRAAGTPVVQIADRLGMSPQGARALMSNRVYLGELRVGDHVNLTAHPAIVTVEEFELAQTIVPRPGRNVAKTPALLGGLVRCGGCGHVMSRTGNAPPVYACARRHSGGQCESPAAITLKNLDEHVTEIVMQELDRFHVDGAVSRDDIARARDDLAAAERELSGYLEAVSVDDIGPEAFGAGARGRREKVNAAQTALRACLAVQPITDTLGNGRDAWDQMDAHQRNALLRGLLEAVVVWRGGGRGSRTPMLERVEILAAGAGVIETYRGGGRARGIHPIERLDRDHVDVLRMQLSEDAL